MYYNFMQKWAACLNADQKVGKGIHMGMIKTRHRPIKRKTFQRLKIKSWR